MKSVLIDTNIIIRLLVRDNQQLLQAAQVTIDEIENGSIQGILSILVIGEIIWILENYYKLKRKDYFPYFKKLLALSGIKILETNKALILETLDLLLKHHVDFTDTYLFCTREDREIISFDNDFKKLLKKS